MSKLRPYKFIVQAIPQQLDDDGEPEFEIVGEQIVIIGLERLKLYAENFVENLANDEKKMNET